MSDLHRWAVVEMKNLNPFGRRKRWELTLRSTHKTKTAALARSQPGRTGVFFTRHLPAGIRFNKPIRMIEP